MNADKTKNSLQTTDKTATSANEINLDSKLDDSLIYNRWSLFYGKQYIPPINNGNMLTRYRTSEQKRK